MDRNPSRTRENFNQLREVFLNLLPKNKAEIGILLFFIVLYSSYGLILAVNTSIIDYKELLYDVYFSFDNPIIYRQGYVYLEGHPLMMFMTMPFITLGNLLATLFGYKAKTVFLSFICSVLISFSIVYVYRYLREIIELSRNICYLLIAFFAFTSTNLILSFTPESFTITSFFLSYTVYYYSYCIKNKKAVRLLSNTFFAVTLGGITITNFIKGIIPLFFVDDDKKIIVRKIFITGIIFSIIVLWIQLQYDFISLIEMRLTGNISVPARGNIFERIFDWLFSAPILFPAITMMDINIDGLIFNAISLDFYHRWWQYLFAVLLLTILFYSILKNYKNKFVVLILSFLAVDIIIHVLIRYGLRDAFIYGGHWVFFVPLLLGWLYRSLEKERYKKFLFYIITGLFIALVINNVIRLKEFIELSLINFPPY